MIGLLRGVAAVPLALAAAGQPQPATPVFGVSVETVRVEVLVTTREGPVRGLRVDDFEVRDSGVLQQLEPLLEESAPLDTVLVLDRSDSVTGRKLEALREAAAAYLDAVRPGERVSLLGFASRVTLQRLMAEDLARVRELVGRASIGGSTSLCDAIYAGLRLAEPGRRTAVVVFSDGLDNSSWLRPEQVVEAARRSEALVYGVVAGDPWERDQTVLRDVAKATGGRVFEVREAFEMRRRFLDVLEDIRNRYVLSYVPSGVERPGWHPLEVRLKRSKGAVLARPGYWRSPSP